MLRHNSLQEILLLVPVLLISLTVHEMAHGLAAYALGDNTAKREGRLSLNPIHHIDWIGFILLMTVGFGWAKPVPVDPRYFKDPKKSMALTSLAGPFANILLAFLGAAVLSFTTDRVRLLSKLWHCLFNIIVPLQCLTFFRYRLLTVQKLWALSCPTGYITGICSMNDTV